MGSEVAETRRKEELGWWEWGKGLCNLLCEFFFQRIAARNLDNPLRLPALAGRTFVVTGSTSGIGLQIARQLALAGGHVVMAVRKTKLAHELIQRWQDERSSASASLNVEVMELDLLSLESVVKFAEAWNTRSLPLHVLINNAGVFAIGEPQRFSKDGHEEHLQVNHLAPSLLSMLLLPSLLRGSPSRIINVNSIMHQVGFIDTEDMNVTSGKRKYTSVIGYSGSKLAELKFSSILQKKIPPEAGVHVICVSPGIVHTNVARDLPKILIAAYGLIPYFIFDAQEGARSSLFAATDPEILDYCRLLKSEERPTCAYISYNCRPVNSSESAHDLQTSLAVWNKTLEMIGLPSDALEKLLGGREVHCLYGRMLE